MNILKVLNFIVTTAGGVSFLPYWMWIIDLAVVTFLRILTGSTMGLFSPRVHFDKDEKKVSSPLSSDLTSPSPIVERMSIKDILKEADS